MSAMSSARATAVTTTTAASPPLPEMSPSRFPNSRGFPLKLSSLNGIAAGRAAWKRLSLRCTLCWSVLGCDIWSTSILALIVCSRILICSEYFLRATSCPNIMPCSIAVISRNFCAIHIFNTNIGYDSIIYI